MSNDNFGAGVFFIIILLLSFFSGYIVSGVLTNSEIRAYGCAAYENANIKKVKP